MAQMDDNNLVQQLITGFEVLQNDYEKLFRQHQTLESKLSIARDQYNELAKLLGKNHTDTPPLSLASNLPAYANTDESPPSAVKILELRDEHNAAQSLRIAIDACTRYKKHSTGVKIWSGPSADTTTVSSKLPSITESPMEQDFTIVGTPSKLGCPFASMAGKKLSNHAASVLNRYHGSHSPRDGQSSVRETGSIAESSLSRLNSVQAQQTRARRVSSIVDPIKAEICGLDNHDSGTREEVKRESQIEDEAMVQGADAGVCPIRFLNQHSPEELAMYFEKHKHELPRSHEVCVKRYQSNEQQVRELDAKYSDVAQMIRGLGEKHQNYLPKDVDDDGDGVDDAQRLQSTDEARVEKWASNLSAQASNVDEQQVEDEELRIAHFSRPLRDVRLGESPSRPWGISIPVQYLEKAESNASSAPVRINSGGAMHTDEAQQNKDQPSKCPFAGMNAEAAELPIPEGHQLPVSAEDASIKVASPVTRPAPAQAPVIINGPIVIGYGPEEAARFIQNLGRTET